MNIKDQPAIVTGGASGLGGETARFLASQGAKVAIFDLNEELGQAHAKEIGGRFYKTDVTSDEGVQAAVAAAEKDHGIARICVNCAGMAPPAKVINRDGTPIDLAKFSKIIEVNLIGTFNVLSKFAARCAQADPIGEERGVIINTASVAGIEGQIGQPAYGSSKAGVIGLTLPVARELARYGIRVMTIAPGIFLTPMLASLPEAAQKSLGEQVPFPSRLGMPDEYAKLCQAIIENPMLNGETIRLDGAIRMAPK